MGNTSPTGTFRLSRKMMLIVYGNMIFTPEILFLVALVPWIEQLWFHNTKMVGYFQGGVFVLDHTIFLWWFNHPVIRQLVTASAVGATMPSINTSILNSIRIVFPQKDIVTQFCKMADGLIEIIATNLEEIRKLNDAREYIQLSLSR